MNSDSWKSQCSLKVLKQRAFLMSKIREYFAIQDVLEVETPILSSAGNTDVNIESFTSDSILVNQQKCYLRTSPEFPLKRLLCSGTGDVFEIGKVFRKGEISNTHNVEFTLLEWYRVGYHYKQLIQDVSQLFEFILSAFNLPIPPAKILTYRESFQLYLSIDIQQISIVELNLICEKTGYSGSQLSKDEALDFLFATQVQPSLNKKELTFIALYPASQAALSQINPEDINTSLRFEVFLGGHELGNGYQELTHSGEQLNRFEADNLQRASRGLTEITIDDNLISAMENGLPDCSGIAIGIDRLLMSILDKTLISEVLSFNAENS